ncbi:MAG: hypothetical protein CMC73_05955, partial [Flavobacteriaceae bacterium]|nr:hypothetical protein [Flavobacteriaceae bacterium]
ALVQATNKLYMYSGTGWYLIATIQNNAPSAITGVSGTYELAIDGTSTVITAVSTDPEGFPLTWSSSTSGLGSIATVGQGTGEGYAIASAAILSGTHTVNANVGALTFKPDGTEMYYVGTNTDRVSRHTLSTAWDVSTASFVGSSPNTLSQVSNLTDVKFNNDGTKMYMADRAGTTDNTIYQYSLSTAWDPDTATYDNKSYDFTAVLTGDELNCFVFNADGSAVYLAEYSSSRKIYQFTLSTAFDISTATYSNKSLDFASEQNSRPYFQFTNDGTKLFMINTFHTSGFVGKIYEYSLTTAYDISTASYTNVNYAPSGITTGRSALAFKPDGSKMFIMGTDNHTTISQFNLPIYADNQFVITPSTTEADAGTFSLTINATDGVNGAVSTSTNLSLNFIVTVTNSRYTTLLATATGTSDNNNITDASTNNHSITVNGDAYAGTFSPYRSGGYATSFDGTNDYLQTASSDFYLSTSQFSVEVWIKPSSLTGNKVILQADQGSAYQLYTFSTQVKWYTNTAHVGNAGSDILSVGKWTHLLVTRDSNNTLRIFADGILLHVTTNHTYDYGTNNTIFELGYNGSNVFGGEMRDARVISGSIPSDYQTSSTTTTNPSAVITVPTEPLTAVSGTKFLGGHLPYLGYTTASTTGYFNTIGGNPSTKPFSPYNYLEYSATDHGGSVYFDGTGDYLTLGSGAVTIPSGDFTVEAWAYPTGASSGANGGCVLCFGANNGVGLRIFWDVNGNHFRFLITGGSSTGAYIYDTNIETATPFAWYHVAAVRTNGVFKFFVNGVLQGTGSNSVTFDQSAFNLARIGYTTQNTYAWNGYISDVRYNNSTALYTSNDETANVPTAPLSSSGAELHIKGTDASIIDKSQNSNLLLHGNTTGSTTQAKFSNTKSIYFGSPGVGLSTSAPVLDGEFTIEAWVYFNSFSGGTFQTLFSAGMPLGGPAEISTRNNNNTIQVLFGAGGSANKVTATWNSSINTWYHLAIVRDSNSTVAIYVDGTALSNVIYPTQTDTLFGDWNDSRTGLPADLYIGQYDIYNSYPFDGYIQDVRITKGLARYTANFTPPTTPLEG